MTLSLVVIGAPRLVDGGDVLPITRRKAMALLIYLAITKTPHTRDHLCSLFWPGSEQSRARAALRTTLADLRLPSLEGHIHADRETIAINGLEVDVHQFEQAVEAVRQGEGTPEQQITRLNEAIELFAHGFLEGFHIPDSPEYEAWQRFTNARLEHDLNYAFEQLLSLVDHDETLVRVLTLRLRHDPYHEPSYQRLMLLMLQRGARHEALQWYEACVARLDEIGLEPVPDTRRIHRAIMDEGSAMPNLGSAGILPPVPQVVIGREALLGEVSTMLRELRGTVVLQGWPGVGKSVMAAAAAHDGDLHATYSDGVFWTSLGEQPNLMARLETWVTSLPDFDAAHGITKLKDLQGYLTSILRDRRVLLIVDDVWNAEHIQPFQVGGVDAAMLVTTRFNDVARRVATSPEHIVKVPVLEQTAGVALLKHLAPEAVRQHEADALALVRDLEGLPLALQVAGRMLHAEASFGWGVGDLLDDLRQGTPLLKASAPVDIVGDSTLTVFTLLQKSTDRLSPEIRERFAMLALFAPKPATFDLNAMKAVWGTDDARPTVRTLVNRGLLEPIGQGRFQVHALLVMHAKQLAEQMDA